MIKTDIKEIAWKVGICGQNTAGEVITDWGTIERLVREITKETAKDCARIARDAEFGYEIARDITDHFGI